MTYDFSITRRQTTQKLNCRRRINPKFHLSSCSYYSGWIRGSLNRPFFFFIFLKRGLGLKNKFKRTGKPTSRQTTCRSKCQMKILWLGSGGKTLESGLEWRWQPDRNTDSGNKHKDGKGMTTKDKGDASILQKYRGNRNTQAKPLSHHRLPLTVFNKAIVSSLQRCKKAIEY